MRWVARTYQVDADFDAALGCVEAAPAAGAACGDDAAVGQAVNLQANVRVQQGRLDAAEALYEQARASAVRGGETNLAAMTAQNLGVIANIRGDRERALANHENSRRADAAGGALPLGARRARARRPPPRPAAARRARELAAAGAGAVPNASRCTARRR